MECRTIPATGKNSFLWYKITNIYALNKKYILLTVPGLSHVFGLRVGPTSGPQALQFSSDAANVTATLPIHGSLLSLLDY